MHIVALGQGKGGTGKSCAAINLACQAVAAGTKTALVDMDAEQGSTSKWGKRRQTGAPYVTEANAVTLPPLLAKLRAESYEWAFLDLPGRDLPVSSAGLIAADLILVPVRPFDIDVEASTKAVQAAKRAKRPYAFLLNISPPHAERKRARALAETLSSLGHSVSPVIIVQRNIVPDSIAIGKCTCEAEPSGESAREFAELFNWLTKEIP